MNPAATLMVTPLTARLREHDDRRGGSVAVSVVLHALILSMVLWLTERDMESGTGALGPPGTGGGGGGGEVIAYVSLPGDPSPLPLRTCPRSRRSRIS